MNKYPPFLRYINLVAGVGCGLLAIGEVILHQPNWLFWVVFDLVFCWYNIRLSLGEGEISG